MIGDVLVLAWRAAYGRVWPLYCCPTGHLASLRARLVDGRAMSVGMSAITLDYCDDNSIAGLMTAL